MLVSFYIDEFYGVPDEAAAAELLALTKRAAETLNVNVDAVETLNKTWGVENIPEDNYFMQLGTYVRNESEALLVYATGLNGDFMSIAGALEQFGGKLLTLNDKIFPLGLVGMNSASPHAETAAQFIQTLLSEDVQKGGATQRGFSVSAAALDALLATEADGFSGGYNFGVEFRIGWPSAAAREKLGAVIRGLNAPLNNDRGRDTLQCMPHLQPCPLEVVFSG